MGRTKTLSQVAARGYTISICTLPHRERNLAADMTD
jgi:hypothetical protein